MKINLISITVITIAVAAAICSNLHAAETNAATVRIGVYDSRAVAYAWFWSEKHQKELKDLMKSTRDAQAAGETNRFTELAAALSRHQDNMHREVFSTAPASEALVELKPRLPQIQKTAGVSDIVSKWDDVLLKKYAAAEQVDVTDVLVHEFITPTEQQQKIISSIRKSDPISLDECNELIRKGKI